MNQKEKIQQILFDSFYDNNSTQFVIKKDHKYDKRLRLLLDYSWFMTENYGEAVLNEDGTACALILYPKRKKFSLKAIWWDLKLAFGCIGLGNLGKVMKREKAINSMHPDQDFIYVWYVGVDPKEQGRGLGSTIMNQIKELSKENKMPVVLETSKELNYKFYEKLDFKVIGDLSDLGYGLKTFAYNLN